MSEQADPPKEKPRSITIKFPDNNPEMKKKYHVKPSNRTTVFSVIVRKGKEVELIIVERINHFLRNSPTALQQKKRTNRVIFQWV